MMILPTLVPIEGEDPHKAADVKIGDVVIGQVFRLYRSDPWDMLMNGVRLGRRENAHEAAKFMATIYYEDGSTSVPGADPIVGQSLAENVGEAPQAAESEGNTGGR